jgi:hypothetical protein
LASLMSSILLTLFKGFCLHCANFYSTGLSSSKISSFLLWSNKLCSAVRVMNFISAVCSLLISLCFNVQISQPLMFGDQRNFLLKRN